MKQYNDDTQFLDILRALATVSVITLHVGGGTSVRQDVITRGIFTAINVWCVPVFLMITGALFLCVKEELDLNKHLKRTFHLLALALLWNYIYTVLSLIIINRSINGGAVLLDSAKMVINADFTYGYHLWYLYAVIGIYLMLPILRKWFTRSTQNEHTIYLLIFCLFSLALPSFVRIAKELKIAEIGEIWDNNFHYFSGLIVYVLLGAYLYKYKATINEKIVITIGAIIIALYMILGFINIETLNRIIRYDSCSSAVLAVVVFEGIREWSRTHTISKFLCLIADHSLSIYFVHVIVIQVLRKVFHLSSESGPLIITLPIITGLTLVISLGIVTVQNPYLLQDNLSISGKSSGQCFVCADTMLSACTDI